MPTNNQITRNFSEAEFACKCGCGLQNINIGLVKDLQETRSDYGCAMTVVSGLRCPTWNKACGGSKNSSHLTGLAVDIYMDDSVLRHRLIRTILEKGWMRIGISKAFVHLDIDYAKTNPVIWTY
jgi:zinc D-Ala-D-Ala carboxypeptidase|tara:strand:+ start:82 stop:453 length:372 start_codon:yes stop_codon:yes gene_type:complete